jgi:hypothetical protein
MRTIAQIISWLALAALILPSLFYLNDRMDLPTVKTWMLVATVIWFIATPIWMNRKPA